MKINFNNYESYFLLYIDNELSVQEREMVESFAAQNPALKEELELLQDTVLPHQDVIEFNKESLYKSIASIDIHKEEMLLHLDNELPSEAKALLIQKIRDDDAMQKEWNLLQKTKLDAADVVFFPGKETLYKREPARIVSFSFTKWAVAAAIIAGGVFWGIRLNDKETVSVPGVAQNDTNGIKNSADQQQQKTEIAVLPDVVPENNAVSPELTEAPEKESSLSTKNTKPVKKAAAQSDNKIITEEPAQNNKPILAINQPKEVNRISKPDASTMNIKRTTADKSELLTAMTAKERPKNLEETVDRNIMPVTNSFASTASLNEPTQNDDHIFFLDQEKLAESKAGAFLKKLKRTVTRTTNISPTKTLKIAGFEFAVK